MPASPAISGIANSAARPPSDGVMHNLMDLLVTLELQVSAENTQHAEDEIVLDTEVNGVRYLVVRMPRPVHTRVQLSPREQEIVRMVAQGHPNKVIADVLNISSWTVCTHLRRIFAKLGVGSRAAMVAQLIETGVIRKEHRTLTNQR